jgi:hypothetical protein
MTEMFRKDLTCFIDQRERKKELDRNKKDEKYV